MRDAYPKLNLFTPGGFYFNPAFQINFPCLSLKYVPICRDKTKLGISSLKGTCLMSSTNWSLPRFTFSLEVFESQTYFVYMFFANMSVCKILFGINVTLSKTGLHGSRDGRMRSKGSRRKWAQTGNAFYFLPFKVFNSLKHFFCSFCDKLALDSWTFFNVGWIF